MSQYKGKPEKGVALHKLNPMPSNHRVHEEEQIDFLRERLKAVGQTRPLIVYARELYGVQNPILAGNGIFEAMLAEGWSKADVIWYDMPEEDAIIESIADNRSHEKSHNDDEILLKLLTDLKEQGVDLTPSGFSNEEYNQLREEMAKKTEEMSPHNFGDSGDPGDDENFDTENQELSKVGVRVGEYKVIVERDDYFKWRDDIRMEVGFSKSEVCAEMCRRLGINEASVSQED